MRRRRHSVGSRDGPGQRSVSSITQFAVEEKTLNELQICVVRIDRICRLCPALKQIFEHGLKRSSLLGGPGHPWLFLEEVNISTNKHDIKSSYYSRNLQKTFQMKS